MYNNIIRQFNNSGIHGIAIALTLQIRKSGLLRAALISELWRYDLGKFIQTSSYSVLKFSQFTYLPRLLFIVDKNKLRMTFPFHE